MLARNRSYLFNQRQKHPVAHNHEEVKHDARVLGEQHHEGQRLQHLLIIVPKVLDALNRVVEHVNARVAIDIEAP